MNTKRQFCDFSCTEKMCVSLDNAGVPREDRWRSLAIYMRGLSNHNYLTGKQKAQIQSLFVNLLQEGDYSDDNFENILIKKDHIFSAPYEKKIKDAVDESHKLLTDFRGIMNCRKTDMADIESDTELALEQGKEPSEIISNIRVAFKSLIQTMAQDAEQLEYLCKTDALTHLHNRRSFDQFLEESVKNYVNNGVNFSLIMLDIDFFKKFNDKYGHRVGDQALVTVGKIIKRCQEKFTQMDGLKVFAARYGGEEFALIVPGFTPGEAYLFAEYVRECIADYNFLIRNSKGDIIEKGINITASFGVSDLPVADLIGTKGEPLVEAADQALYNAKENGRNNVFRYFAAQKCA